MAEVEKNKNLFDWFKENGLNLLVTLLFIGVSYGVIKTEFSYFKDQTLVNKTDVAKHEERLVSNERNISELKLLQAQSSTRLERQENESRQNQKDVSDIKAIIGVLSTKLDNVIELNKTVVEEVRRLRTERSNDHPPSN